MIKKFLVFLMMFAVTFPAIGAPIAFPGAEGFGANSVGGRGGKVCEVTNLNDSGVGSFRDCATKVGPRTIVFRTGGTISLASQVLITNPFLTIAGQTAPGAGICIRNAAGNRFTPIMIRTHDVIIRFIRVRPGLISGVTVDSLEGVQIGQDGAETFNVILDHNSISWGTDGNLQHGSQAHDITVQWCLLSEPLNNAGHSKGTHGRSYNLYNGSAGSNQEMNGRSSIHHNLMGDCEFRVPQISIKHGLTEVINNVVYHTTQISMNINSNAHGTTETYNKNRFIKNYFLRTNNSKNEISLASESWGWPGVLIYALGNIGPSRLLDSAPQQNSIEVGARSHYTSDPLLNDSNGTFPSPTVIVTQDLSAAVTLARISETGAFVGKKNVGAVLPKRDAVDTRILANLQRYIANPTDPNTVPVPGGPNGGLLDDPAQVGGYPVLGKGTPLLDTDHDGMPDNWELIRGLNPNFDDGALDRNNDGWTNLEEYINGLAKLK